jgi:hypothetical protein
MYLQVRGRGRDEEEMRTLQATGLLLSPRESTGRECTVRKQCDSLLLADLVVHRRRTNTQIEQWLARSAVECAQRDRGAPGACASRRFVWSLLSLGISSDFPIFTQLFYARLMRKPSQHTVKKWELGREREPLEKVEAWGDRDIHPTSCVGTLLLPASTRSLSHIASSTHRTSKHVVGR